MLCCCFLKLFSQVKRIGGRTTILMSHVFRKQPSYTGLFILLLKLKGKALHLGHRLGSSLPECSRQQGWQWQELDPGLSLGRQEPGAGASTARWGWAWRDVGTVSPRCILEPGTVTGDTGTGTWDTDVPPGSSVAGPSGHFTFLDCLKRPVLSPLCHTVKWNTCHS